MSKYVSSDLSILVSSSRVLLGLLLFAYAGWIVLHIRSVYDHIVESENKRRLQTNRRNGWIERDHILTPTYLPIVSFSSLGVLRYNLHRGFLMTLNWRKTAARACNRWATASMTRLSDGS